jgi:hypothetical protein
MAKTEDTESQPFLICNVSFVGFYDGEGTRSFRAAKGDIIEADSREAKLWGKSVDLDGNRLFRELTPSFLTAKQQMVDPYLRLEQATAAPGEKRDS